MMIKYKALYEIAINIVYFYVVLVPLTELQRKEGYVFFFRYVIGFILVQQLYDCHLI